MTDLPRPHLRPTRTSLADLADPDANWRASALCAQADPDAWFPDAGDAAHDAKKICARCPVSDPCAVLAQKQGEQSGVWGGRSAVVRRKKKAS